MAKTSPMAAQIQDPWRDGGAVAACLGLSPFWGQSLCSPVDFPRDYRGHFTLLTCCFVPPFLDSYYSSPSEDKRHRRS